MLHNHLDMNMRGMHMSVFRMGTSPVLTCSWGLCEVCVCVWSVFVFWNVPGLIGRLRNAEYYLSPREAGLECGPILLSAVTYRFTLHTSPGWLHFQFRARFHYFTRTCVLAAGVEAQKSPDFSFLIGALFYCISYIARLAVFPLYDLKNIAKTLL